jgi:asparagine synthase (glutamine-hydrolysing)
MCGITGIIHPQAHQYIADASKRMAHRGPDDEGVFTHKNLALAHRRLAILDLSENGHQPMISENGRYVLVFNGEIYNHLELRNSLENKYSFKSSTDTETLLHGLIEFGKDFIKQLNGIFAFVFFDTETEELLIVRDQFGVKPLYYYADNQTFAFGSEIKSFLALPDFDKEIDKESLVNYLTLLWSAGEKTPFQKVKKLLAGHYLTLNLKAPSDFQIHQHFQIPFTGEYSQKTENELIAELEKRLLKAVERQLMADVPLGFFLSGGLDSSAIVAMARKLHPNKILKCYTIKTNSDNQKTEGFSNDLQYARLVAKHLNLDLVEVESEVNIQRDFDEMIYHLDEPQADFASINVLNICKLAQKQGYKVLLGGVGGDELFSGYRRHKALAFHPYLDFMPTFIGKIISHFLPRMNANFAILRRVKKILNGLNLTKNQRLFQYYEWIPLEVVRGLFRDRKNVEPYSPQIFFEKLLKEIPQEKNDLNKLLFWDMKTFLPDHNLNYTDKMSMATGVEVRVPFLDIELLEFSCQIPTKLKMKGMTTKYLLKKLMEKYLPHEVIYRSKTGFGVPLRQWIKYDLDTMIQQYLNKKTIEKRGVFEYESVRNLLENNKKGKIDASYSILCLMAIESWHRQFIDKN